METILIRYGEIALKKGNRKRFEKRLVDNIKNKITEGIIRYQHGRIFLDVQDFDETLINKLKTIPGITSFSPVIKVEKNFDIIKNKWTEIIDNNPKLKQTSTFKFEVKRVDKSFAIHSDEMSKLLAEAIIEKFPEFSTKVKLKNPELTFYVEIRNDFAYLFYQKYYGVGGLPVGIAGKSLTLLSGGIDSPVAAYLVMKRGMKSDFIYFHAPPFTSEDAKEKVINLAKILTEYEIKSRLYIIPFTDIQTKIRTSCNISFMTILMRRAMMNISARIGNYYKYDCLVTGESLSQVASQTINSLKCTDDASNLFVLRPLIGFDKEETIKIAENIGTFEISILPFADCCSLFTPSKPVINPKLEEVKKEEEKWFDENLINESLDRMEIIKF
ncbi:MAG TPA: tRNA uracil 4-sulfurtransferase ThiI [Exilispira sp.]|nr:tRNA uracil 4-sulfurtransferase ThiI [Exilispira sp.]